MEYGYIGEARHTPHIPDKSHIPASCLADVAKTRGRNVTLVRNMWSVSCFTDVAICMTHTEYVCVYVYVRACMYVGGVRKEDEGGR